MIKPVGYELQEEIHHSKRSIVYRGRRTSNGAPVIVKLMNDEYPSADAVARFKREYEIGQLLSGQGTIKTEGLEPVRNSWAIVMEDLGARSLRSLLDERRLGLGEALSLGARIAGALAAIHHKRIIHKDVNPSNIVVAPSSEQVRFIDFGLSSALPRETPTLNIPSILEGTLRYISPEQTGRMNRTIDYRTDLYSFGVTLYEMLTGKVPFASSDALELVHLHIAQRPVPPHEVEPAIPPPVSKVVMKLLAKTAEERYQSALGLEADLQTCLAALSAGGSVPSLKDFVPGTHDVSDRFDLPQQLYGREAELRVLLKTLESVATGRAELLLLSGYSGVGKSALVSEIHKPVLARRGNFVAGKFDLLQRDIPYASMIQAFTELVRQLLTGSEEQLSGWRARLTEALGTNGQVIADVIPNVTHIVGPLPPLPPLPPAEAQLRFNLVFRRFVQAFASEGHPLVMFLDDLQWADLPSLKLIEALLTEPELSHFLLIGAYRDSEVSAVHPLTMLRESLEKAGVKVTGFNLSPLDLRHVERLVADTLRCEPTRAAPLAQLAFERTGGNPFFLGQLLRTMHEDGLIQFDAASRAWRWDIGAIRMRGLTADVVSLMTRKLQRLPEKTQLVLQLAACVGNRFDLETLALVHQHTSVETAADLNPAIEAGLLLAEQSGVTGTQYRFLHDRVQQAAYSLIAEKAREEIHLRIGRQLLAGTPAEQLDARLFDIVHQLNLGGALEHSPEQRRELARLNLLAGQKAKASAAYEPALRCFTAGLSLLPENAWAEHYELCHALHVGAMEMEYLNAHQERGEELSTLLLEKGRTPLERVGIHETRATFSMMRDDLQRAREEGQQAMALLGLPLRQNMDLPGFLELIADTQRQLAGRPANEWLAQPPMTDPRLLAATRVALMLVPPLFMESPLLSLAVQIDAMRLCLEHGNAPETPYFHASYGMILSVFVGDADNAAAYGRMSIELVNRLGAKRHKAKVYMVAAAFALHWKIHLRETLPILQEAVQAGLEVGDHEFMGYAAGHICSGWLNAGEPLDAVLREHDRYLPLLERWKLTVSALPARIQRQLCLCLMGRTPVPSRLTGEDFDATVELPRILESKNYSTASAYHANQTLLSYLFRDAERAAEVAEVEESFVNAQVGLPIYQLHNCYQSLALLTVCRTASEEDRVRHLAKVERNQEQMKRWAEQAPMNALHRYQLIEAERARLRGDVVAASRLYEEAARGAMEHRYLYEEALAHELAGEFYSSIGRERLARESILDAANSYRRWGAEAKVADLERRYPEVFALVPAQSTASANAGLDVGVSADSTNSGAAAIDLATVLKAAQAISGEIVLDRLLDKLMRITIENAGAQHGCLLLEKGGQLSIEVRHAIDGGATQEELPRPLDGNELLSTAIVKYVARTGEVVVLKDAVVEGLFTADPHIQRRHVRSVLCAPLINQGRLLAVVYLENNLTPGAFSADRLEVLRLLSAQAALSIQNALLYAKLEDYSHTLEQKVEERTREIMGKNEELGRTLEQLRAMQQQLVSQEKLASLGALTAGIAHELKNPLNFIKNFSELVNVNAEELTQHLKSQRARLTPESLEDIDEASTAIRDNARRINEHERRANEIINAMLMHSRQVNGAREPVDLNRVLAESINLAYRVTRGKQPTAAVTIDADYDPAIGMVEMAAADISRVFVNIVDNACYALQQKRARDTDFDPRLTVRTRARGNHVEVRIRDNGAGIPSTLVGKIFDPFFTTKPAGEGTGLGLSLSHDIVVRHRGTIRVDSVHGEFTEFIIDLPRFTYTP